MDLLTQILLALVSAGTLGNIILYIFPWKRRAEQATAEKSVKDLYEERIADLHNIISTFNDIEATHASRIKELNEALDGKTDRIRSLTDQLYGAEQGRNEDKDTITRLTADNGRLRVEVEHYKSWLCKEADCPHRQPPNPKIAGKKYTKPAQQ